MATSKKPKTSSIGAIAEALFSCLENTRWEAISMTDIAAKSGLSLTELRGVVNSKMDIMAHFAKDIDSQVLNEVDEDLADEPARERIFDILMARFDALAPYKIGIGQLVKQVKRNPVLALEFNCIACRSQSWMLSGAGVSSSGLMGKIRTQGLVLAFSHVLQIWAEDDDKGLSATMAELDKTLRRGEPHLARMERIVSFFEPRSSSCRSRSKSSKDQASTTA